MLSRRAGVSLSDSEDGSPLAKSRARFSWKRVRGNFDSSESPVHCACLLCGAGSAGLDHADRPQNSGRNAGDPGAVRSEVGVASERRAAPRQGRRVISARVAAWEARYGCRAPGGLKAAAVVKARGCSAQRLWKRAAGLWKGTASAVPSRAERWAALAAEVCWQLTAKFLEPM